MYIFLTALHAVTSFCCPRSLYNLFCVSCSLLQEDHLFNHMNRLLTLRFPIEFNLRDVTKDLRQGGM